MLQKFSEEHKAEAVKMVLDNKVEVAQLAEALGIKPRTLDKWIEDYKSKEASRSVFIEENSELKKLKSENQKLRAENQKLKAEADLLKKVAVFFANKSSS